MTNVDLITARSFRKVLQYNASENDYWSRAIGESLRISYREAIQRAWDYRRKMRAKREYTLYTYENNKARLVGATTSLDWALTVVANAAMIYTTPILITYHGGHKPCRCIACVA